MNQETYKLALLHAASHIAAGLVTQRNFWDFSIEMEHTTSSVNVQRAASTAVAIARVILADVRKGEVV